MRYRYTFQIKSCVNLDARMRFSDRGFTFEFVPTRNRLTSLEIETPNVDLPLWPKSPAPSPGEIRTVTAPPEPLLAALRQEMRALRGALNLWGVIDIDVDQPGVDFLPTSKEEESHMDLLGVHLKRRPRHELETGPPTPDILIRCTLNRDKFGDYEIPLELYRRGDDDCYNETYIGAVFNFFFVLEYFFGEGSYKSRDLKTNFAKSSQLTEALLEARARMQAAAASEQWARDAKAKYDADVSDIVEKVVELRGFLHHQSDRRPRNWNPGTQHEFEADARFMGLVCQSLLVRIAIDILFAEDAKRQFLATPVFNSTTGAQIRWIPNAPPQSQKPPSSRDTNRNS